MAIAQAVIDTYAAANAVLKDPTLVGPMRWISAAAVIATGLANVQQIMQFVLQLLLCHLGFVDKLLVNLYCLY